MRTEPKRPSKTLAESPEAKKAECSTQTQPKKLTLAAWGPEITVGSKALVARHVAARRQGVTPMVAPSARHSDAQKIEGALADQTKAPSEKPPAPPPSPPRPQVPPGPYKLIPVYGGPQASAEMQFQAYQKLGALAQEHEGSLAKIDARVRLAESEVVSARSLQREHAAKGVFHEGVRDAVWAAERDVMALHEARRDLGEKYGAAKFELEKIVGIENGAGAGPGRDVGPATSFKSFEEKLAAYNRSIDTLKRSGVFAVGVAGYAMSVEVGYGQRLGKRDREIMDRIGTMGGVAQQAAGAAVAQRGGGSGARPPAPGIDHRQQGIHQSQAQLWQQRQAAEVGKR